MTDYTAEELEAVQGVVDRVASYQETAPEGTIEKELAEALDEAGLDLTSAEIKQIADAIDADGSVQVSDLLAPS